VVIGGACSGVSFEKNVDNVKKAVSDLKIGYPVAIDNDYAIWRAFNNQYWPAHYFIDVEGRIRHHHFGESDYEGSERSIRQLLGEAGKTNLSTGVVAVNASGAEAAADMKDVQSPETYIGYDRAENFVSPGARYDFSHVYVAGMPRLNEWGLAENGRSVESMPSSTRKTAVSFTGSTRAICIWFSDRGRTVSRSDSASRSTARHPAPATARMSMPTARAS